MRVYTEEKERGDNTSAESETPKKIDKEERGKDKTKKGKAEGESVSMPCPNSTRIRREVRTTMETHNVVKATPKMKRARARARERERDGGRKREGERKTTVGRRR